MATHTRSRSRSLLRSGAASAAIASLPACSTTYSANDTALAPGQSATLRLVGPPIHVDIHNTGPEPLQYTLSDERGMSHEGWIGPGGRVIERRSSNSTLTITNPGAGLVVADLAARSRRGFEFTFPETSHPPERPR